MKKSVLLSVLLSFWVLYPVLAQTSYPILPKPLQLVPKEGTFILPQNPVIAVASTDPVLRRLAEALANKIGSVTGKDTKVFAGNFRVKDGINFVTSKDDKLGDEGYFLEITPKRIIITAEQPKGFFYGIQSLLQLMPAEIYGVERAETIKWSIPCCLIEDRPRYAYRGLMLDAARYFYPVSFIKKYIDLIALHKMNTFHWHLTDDQGWRIEIKKYPKLTQIGAQRRQTMLGHYSDQKYDGKPYGGFYTQDEIREVVKYAQERFVTVIPEIEMPGHALAALAAYPEYGNNPDKIYQVGTKWGVHEDVFAPREETFRFLEGILTEVLDLFPSQYIHIGGDECPKKQWAESRFCQELIKKEGLKDEHELQSYFIRRIDKFITSKGRKMIGWDEILEGGISPNATVMSWQGIEGGVAAAKQRHDAIMTPGNFCYLDHYQADAKTQPIAIGGFTPLEESYLYEPTPSNLTPDEAKHIIGVQGNVWTEYMPTSEYVEYMTFPRACALAEVGWTAKNGKNIDDFKKRLDVHKKRLDHLNVNYFEAPTNHKFTYRWPLKK
ncbi:beta-N-acetylhexosaminidase [Runella aurantiaca]|uniref:beta-N-acetylhexosaminidase n=1 Tax=Runella aurantiaca TaxID=2282308 RepID=A0A369IBT7_9BACT|nr:beta-N-acetylhexosaminidase [Runella aurantiaca]RDB06340.1 beta-N-acetylglucosaminidase [Runella aurantiaca]